MKFKFKNLNSESGVSLIITFFVMIIILAVVLFVSVLLYSQIKVIKNLGDSMVSFYAADSGIEKVLFYDRKVIPILAGNACTEENPCAAGQTCTDGICTTPAARGLCSMFDTCSLGDSSINCKNQVSPEVADVQAENNTDGCDLDVCKNCQISFETTFDDRTYFATAKVYPTSDGTGTNFSIESRGVFASAQRQIKVLLGALQAQEAIVIKNACAIPKSNPQGTNIDISAVVTPTVGDTIANVAVIIHDCAPGTTIYSNFDLTGPGSGDGSGVWAGSWSTGSNAAQKYCVDITATDTLETPNVKTLKNIQPYPLCITQ